VNWQSTRVAGCFRPGNHDRIAKPCPLGRQDASEQIVASGAFGVIRSRWQATISPYL
jgi:hypothetical protein